MKIILKRLIRIELNGFSDGGEHSGWPTWNQLLFQMRVIDDLDLKQFCSYLRILYYYYLYCN